METKFHHIKINKQSVSDDAYVLKRIFFENGDKVNSNDIIASLESSKAAIDLEAGEEGYIFFNTFKIDEEILIGTIFAVITPSNSLPINYFEQITKKLTEEIPAPIKINGTDNKNISKQAQSLIDENKIDISVFEDKPFIRKEDVQSYLDKKDNSYLKNPPNIYSKSNLIVIIGGGGHAKMCIDIIRQMGTYQILGIIDPKLPVGADCLGVPVLGEDKILEDLYSQGVKNAVIAIGSLNNLSIRSKIYESLKKTGFYLPIIIHPKAIVEPSAQLEEGTQVMAGAIIGSAAIIESNCIINSGSIVSHDCHLYNNVHIAPGAILAGLVKVGSNSIIGMGSTIYINVTIGEGVVIGNGANIFHNIASGTFIK